MAILNVNRGGSFLVNMGNNKGPTGKISPEEVTCPGNKVWGNIDTYTYNLLSAEEFCSGSVGLQPGTTAYTACVDKNEVIKTTEPGCGPPWVINTPANPQEVYQVPKGLPTYNNPNLAQNAVMGGPTISPSFRTNNMQPVVSSIGKMRNS